MKTSTGIWLGAIVTVGCVSGCASEGGRVSGGIYTSPLYNFTVPVPDLGDDARLDDSASDQSGSVTFYDGDASLLRIEYVRMNSEAAARHADPERRDYAYRNYAHEFILPAVQEKFPGTEILCDDYVGKGVWRSFFFVIRIPDGFSYDDPRTGERHDATAAYMMFSSGNFMYVVAEERVADSEAADLSKDACQAMAGRVIEFGATISFH